MIHLYDSEFFNTKITQFDDSHIQIDFSSITYERGCKREKSHKTDTFGPDFNIRSSEEFSLSTEENLITNCKSYSSSSRTKRGVYSVARSNSWDWFVTFTFDNKVIDRSDFALCKKKFSKFWDNLRQKKYPYLKYLFIVEMHKNLEGFHYHGVISGIPDSAFTYFRRVRGSYNKSQKKYFYYDAFNFPAYKLGFNSCCRILDSGKVLQYVTKYITKTAFLESRLNQKFKHLYFHSNNLNKPDIKRVCIDTRKIDIYDFIEDNFPDYEIVYKSTSVCRSSGSFIDYIQLVKRE